ncbi:LexA family protein [Pontibacter sp. MBLB2868]|uniref:LexA family protein n=1 Tax=Pontibacter sp. MBLB2868 TaxID=3451555 RepID=UPI003F74B587
MYSTKVIPIRSRLLETYSITDLPGVEIPVYASYVSAGFPSPADDYLEDRIDLSKYLIQNPTSTFMMRVKGNSMMDAQINDGDMLVIDKALKPADGYPVVCFLDGEFTVKTFKLTDGKAYLVPANPAYKAIEITDEMDMRVWGVVVWILHKPTKQ